MAYTSSATNSFAQALSCIPFEKGDCILLANEDYISNQLAFLSLRKRLGVELVRARSSPEGGVDVEDMERLMLKHRPRLLTLSHIPTNSGLVQPVEEVGKLCSRHDQLYLVDACQSVGQMPLDVSKIKCDFLSGTFRKFLRGPRGAGFLYVSDKILETDWAPLFFDMRGADWTDIDSFTLRSDAKRFEEWEVPYALVQGSKAAMDYALHIGLEEIKKRNHELCSRVRTMLQRLQLELLDLGRELSSIITVKIPHKEAEETVSFLRSLNINTTASSRASALIDFKAKGVEWALRISPHYYNTENEIGILEEGLKKLLNH
jgi:selenocysteine lyase/cysteine desulfurase